MRVTTRKLAIGFVGNVTEPCSGGEITPSVLRDRKGAREKQRVTGKQKQTRGAILQHVVLQYCFPLKGVRCLEVTGVRPLRVLTIMKRVVPRQILTDLTLRKGDCEAVSAHCHDGCSRRRVVLWREGTCWTQALSTRPHGLHVWCRPQFCPVA